MEAAIALQTPMRANTAVRLVCVDPLNDRLDSVSAICRRLEFTVDTFGNLMALTRAGAADVLIVDVRPDPLALLNQPKPGRSRCGGYPSWALDPKRTWI